MTPKIVPISDLNISSVGWILKARVTRKQKLYHYEKGSSKGDVFNFDILDSGGGEIRVICFNKTVNKFYCEIVPGQIYMITRGTLRPRSEFNHVEHDCEILLKTYSKVELCEQDDGTIAMQKFNFRPISVIGGMVEKQFIDIIGVVIDVSPGDDNEILEKSLCMMDASGHNVVLDLWGDLFKDDGQNLQNLHDSGEFPILAVKSGRVSEISGKKLGTIKSTLLYINPDSDEARNVKEWFDREGKNIIPVSVASTSQNSQLCFVLCDIHRLMR